MRVERLLRKMEERAKRRQKRKEEVCKKNFFRLEFDQCFFSGQHFIKRKNQKDMMIPLKQKIFVMQEKIWEIIF
jgi:hypothetical protein